MDYEKTTYSQETGHQIAPVVPTQIERERKLVESLVASNQRFAIEYLANFEPHPSQVDDAAMWRSHDFGLLDEAEKNKARFQARQWLLAWQKALTR